MAAAGEYTGTVSTISADRITLSTESGEIRALLTDNTEFTRAGGMGGGEPKDAPVPPSGEGEQGGAPGDAPKPPGGQGADSWSDFEVTRP